MTGDLPSEPGPAPADFLDALIGDLRLEAARRRAAPAYPLEEEVALGAALAEQAPRPAGVARRLDDLERRLTRLERQAAAGVLPLGADLGADALEWVTAGGGLAGAGRVLYWSADPAGAVAALRGAGIDAYGVDSGGDIYQAGPDVRHGDLLVHLAGAADRALAGAVLIGPAVAAGGYLQELVNELARTADRVLIVSIAPWNWRSAEGPVAADTAVHRPLRAETWVEVLTGAGYTTSADRPTGGQTYRVRAERPA